MKRALILIIAILALTQNASSQTTHYDIDFNAPTYSSGEYKINFGSPQIKDKFGSLTDQPMVFTDSGALRFGYEQIQLDMGLGYSHYTLAFDVETHNLAESAYNFSILFDSSSLKKIIFAEDYLIEASGYTSGVYPRSINRPIAVFEDNTPMHIEIGLDLINDSWTIDTGVAPVYSGLFGADIDDIDDIRFSFGRKYMDDPINENVAVGIDNIKVQSGHAPVPEPGVSCLFGLGSVFFGIKRLLRSRA